MSDKLDLKELGLLSTETQDTATHEGDMTPEQMVGKWMSETEETVGDLIAHIEKLNNHISVLIHKNEVIERAVAYLLSKDSEMVARVIADAEKGNDHGSES